MEDSSNNSNFLDLATEIVSSYVANNHVQPTELPSLIAEIHSTLARVASGKVEQPQEKPVPRMPIKKTIQPDYLVSLEDGKHYKSLKRHLSGRGLTPAQYRAKWDLPNDYPMVAPSYSAQRSELAKKLGLGNARKAKTDTAEASEPAPKRGRKAKAA